MNKLWWNKNYHLVLSFAIPFLLLGMIYASFGIYPFGKGSVLVLDLNGQYVSYFEAFRDAFLDGKSLLYSFSRSLSGEMLGIVAYYLASPFTFLVLLFPKVHITEALLLIALLKVGCSGLTFAFYVSHKKVNQMMVVMLAISYALMSFSVVQVMNIMWIDAIIALPIFILSIERLLTKQSYGLFTWTLIYLFISNYYIAYMVGLLGFGYLIYYSLLLGGKLKTSALFVFFRQTAIAILCTSFLLIPTIYSLTLGKSEFSSPNYDVFSKFNLLDFFVKLLPSTYDSVNIEGLPFIYVGTLVFLFVPLYFMNRAIATKHKMYSFAFMVVLIGIMNVSLLDLLFHGLQNPNWLNYRYAFFFSFFLLTLCTTCLEHLEGIQRSDVMKVMLGSLVFVIFIQSKEISYVDNEATIWVALLCLGLYTGCLLLLGSAKKYQGMKYVMLVVLCIELFTNGLTSLIALDREVLYSTRDSYVPFMEEIRIPLKQLAKEDKGLYRIEKTFHRTVNDPLSLGMKGISHSTSTLNAGAITFLKRMGFSAKDHWTKYLGATPMSDSLLGIRYVLSKDKAVDYYDLAFQSDLIGVYHNPYALALAFGASKDSLDVDMQQQNPFTLQNKMLSSLLGSGYTEYFEAVTVKEVILDNVSQSKIAGHDSYKPIDSSSNAQIEFVLEGNAVDPIYAYFPTNYEREVNLWIDGEWLDTYYGNESYRIMNLSHGDHDRTLVMTIINNEVYLKENTSYFYRLNMEKFAQAIKVLQSQNLKVESYTERKIKGSVEMKENGILFTSLPFEKGWNIRVDGKKVDYYKNMDALVAFDLSEGSHQISMTFTPYGMNVGYAFGVVGIVLWILCLRLDEKKSRDSNIKDEETIS